MGREFLYLKTRMRLVKVQVCYSIYNYINKSRFFFFFFFDEGTYQYKTSWAL